MKWLILIICLQNFAFIAFVIWRIWWRIGSTLRTGELRTSHLVEAQVYHDIYASDVVAYRNMVKLAILLEKIGVN